MGKALGRNLTGLSFSEMSALRQELHRMLDAAFDKLSRGERTAGDKHRIDSDPFHDRLPYREVTLSLKVKDIQP